jgi:isoleucyl-tRNA synthetase
MREQVRLWFYATLFMSVALDGRAPYRRVLSYGRVTDERGREMHKSWGNAIWFDDAVEAMGADTMRWIFAAHDPARDLQFGHRLGDEVERRFLTLWNSYAFLVTYADVAGWLSPRIGGVGSWASAPGACALAWTP